MASEGQQIAKETAVKNSMWKLMESFLSKGVSMIVSIILARLLLPEDYGVIALTTVFINLTDILIQAGFSTALIRKEKVKDEDYATVLGISLISAVVLYGVLFVSAPYVAKAYKTPSLTSVLRVITLTLFCQAFASVRTAVISREMKFKLLFLCTMVSNIISGICGIVFAYLNFGVWALVIQQVSQQFILTMVLFIAVKMKIRFRISKQSIKEIVPFSLKVLASSLLSFAGDSLYSVAIGKVYSMQELGYYDKGGQFPRQFSLYTFSAVSSVFLPVFSSYKEDYRKLNGVFRRVINVSCYIIFPLMMGLCMVAEPFISLLLTDKWLPCVEILRWSCLYYAVTPILLINVQLHFAIGKGETRIKVEVLRILLMVFMFFVFMFYKTSIERIVACLACIQIITTVVIIIETVKITKYKFVDSIKDVIPTLIAVVVMSVGIYSVTFLKIDNNFILLLLEVLVGIVIFLVSSIVLHSQAYKEVLDMIKIILKRKKYE